MQDSRTSAGWLASPRTRRLILTVLAGVGLVLAAPHGWAWYHLRAARRDLARYHPDEAREHLSRCLAVWPGSAEAHLLASRAARQAGDLPAADQELRACRQAGGDKDAVALEWALLQAVDGNLLEVEPFLQRRAEQDPAEAALVWEAVTEGHLRLHRAPDAVACADRWLAQQPGDLRALELRGWSYQAGKQNAKAVPDLVAVLQRDPGRTESRRRLVVSLLEGGSYEEALTHVQALLRERPDDPDLLVRAARCHNMLGRPEEARRILEGILARDPDHVPALRTRGHFALSDREPARAEEWLKRAAMLAPGDYQTQWLYYQALQHLDKKDAAQEQLSKAEQVRDQTERLGELTARKLFERPLDPALHYETGLLLLRAGRRAEAEGWLLSALKLDPDHKPAHAALAELYEQQGDAARAEEHRRLR